MNELPDDAAADLTRWLGPGWTVEPLTGDVSFRRYFRVRTRQGSRILAWYPPELRRQLARVVATQRALSGHLPVPPILETSESTILQEDVGDRALFHVLEEDRERGLRLFEQAVDMLAPLQRLPDPGLNPPFTAEFFLAELDMAREFFVEKLMGHAGTAVAPLFASIAERISRHPYALCHRDYHGHNIHVFNDTLFVIDYQDLRMGPDTYDLASLLHDRGVARLLGEEAERTLVDRGAAAVAASGDAHRRYHETLLQRSVKILGTFAKQPIVRGWMRYLSYIPSTLESIHQCIDQLPRYEPLRDIFPLSFDPDAAAQRARELRGREQ